MDTALSIRFADTEDINAIGFLAQQIWPAAYGSILQADQLEYMLNRFYSPASLRKQMLEDRQQFVLAEDEEAPVGFASYSELGEPATQGSGLFKLHKIYVLQDRQGKGLGKTLLDFVLEDIRSRGGRALQLNVNRYNKARSFYERQGFVVIHEEDIDIGQGYYMNDYVMEKKLIN